MFIINWFVQWYHPNGICIVLSYMKIMFENEDKL